LLTVSRSFMNVANSVLWRVAIILKAYKGNSFVSSVLFVFWYHSPNFLDTPRISPHLHSCDTFESHTQKTSQYHHSPTLVRPESHGICVCQQFAYSLE
jgi:hypothetical protein